MSDNQYEGRPGEPTEASLLAARVRELEADRDEYFRRHGASVDCDRREAALHAEVERLKKDLCMADAASVDRSAEIERLKNMSPVAALEAEVERLKAALRESGDDCGSPNCAPCVRLRAALDSSTPATSVCSAHQVADSTCPTCRVTLQRMFTEEQVRDLLEQARRLCRQACAFKSDRQWIDGVDLKALLEAK